MSGIGGSCVTQRTTLPEVATQRPSAAESDLVPGTEDGRKPLTFEEWLAATPGRERLESLVQKNQESEER
jgi:hypothetical protein